ncbi:MAG: 50S ribosomal protein L11 methyltransferase [Kofleriaceae bacterium]
MARDKNFDLRAALAKPSFTPGQRDIAALVELIASDEAAAVRASPALAKLGDAARAAIVAQVGTIAAQGTTIDDGGAARLIATLGLLARAGDRDARAELIARLGDSRVRIRRAAIVALGKLGATRATRADQREVDLREGARRENERRTDESPPLVDLREAERRGDDRRASEPDDDVRAALIARWDASDVPPDERRALAEALGKIGGAGVRERLEALDATSDKELARRRDRALLVTDREHKRGEDSSVLTDRAPPRPLTVRLGCRPALAELLIAEARAAGFDGKAVRDDAVDVPLDRPWSALFASRLWATAAIRIEDRALREAKGDRQKVTDAIVRAVVSDDVRGLMTAWTRGPIRWRLSLARGHQRAVVWTVANEVTRRAPELVNDPTQTTWDIRVDDEEGVLELVPRRAEDPRYAYRVAEVPAASHPSVAAAVAWLAKLESGERVWDPFCGSGLELVEASLRGASSLVGSDLDDDALAAARANLAAAGIAADAKRATELVRADARRFAPGPVDAIVTNPPLGSRVHVDAGALLAEALPHFARQLRVGGRLVWITPQWRKTTPVAEAHGLVLVRSLFVDLGGVRGRLERWDRQR